MAWKSKFKIGALALALMIAAPAGADYEAGQRAWDAGLRNVAIAEWQTSAEAGEARSMLALGRVYLQGLGVPQNYVEAHKWFNLAASRGEFAAVAERDALAARLSPQERAEAQRLALEWQPSGAGSVLIPADQTGMPSEAIREAQSLLAALGYRPGPADGMWGERTGQALQDFLRDTGLSSSIPLTDALPLLRSAAQRMGNEPVMVSEPVAVQRTGNTPFRDCSACPEIIEVPAGSFLMGAPVTEEGRSDAEGPQREVTIAEPFAVGVYEVTFAEWDACVAGGGCQGYQPGDEGWNRGRRPVINVSWEDAQAYVDWLTEETGWSYRLLSEAEWEYVARAGTRTPFHTGATISTTQANYDGKYIYGRGRVGPYRGQTIPVGSFESNAFGLYDVHGNVGEWVQDCRNDTYIGAPSDGQARTTGDCGQRFVRGGSWYYAPGTLRSANRDVYLTDRRAYDIGFRVARSLTARVEPEWQPFTVMAEPAGAQVRIVNIEEPYEAGMALGPGEYEVEVSAAGYATVRETIQHGREATERRIALSRVEPERQPFTVRAEPAGAQVRIVNLEEPYEAGMALEPGEYEVEVSAAGYETSRATIQHGAAATERRIALSRVEPERQPFTVRAEPAGAQVRIVNIEEPYEAGMALGPGEYEVEVSAAGYATVRETIQHGAAATERRIALVEIGPQPFTVVTEPTGARVRIVNIEERYQAGMALGPGEYEVEVSAAGYETVRETIQHGREATERRIALAEIGPQPFTVVTEPAGARVRIVNIEERYQAGMALGPGEYEVEVSAAGYETVRETIQHGREATERRIALVEIGPQPFTVVTEPAGAQVQIANIEEPYEAGMALAAGAYEVEVSAAGYETSRATIQHGWTATEQRIALVEIGPQPFTVVTEPAGAQVQIANIEEPYEAGMALAAGAYEVEVSAAGYETSRATIQHGWAATEQRIALVRAERERPAGERFRDCSACPEVVVVPSSSFLRGSTPVEAGRSEDEGPLSVVEIPRALAVGAYEVTFAEWDACVSAGGCNGYRPDDAGWGRGRQPVINVTWADAQAYVRWLTNVSGRSYRLLSETEWEYAARAHTRTPFHLGETISDAEANFDATYSYGENPTGTDRRRTVPVGSFRPNAFGLYDMHGNVGEWVQDCWAENYAATPLDGQAWTPEDCRRRVSRGGSWLFSPKVVRSASRNGYDAAYRYDYVGLRIARTLPYAVQAVRTVSVADLQPLLRVPPQYPGLALRRRLEGSVTVRFTVTQEGSVTSPEVVTSDPPGVFDRAALDAIVQWKFQPRLEDGHAVQSRGVQKFDFGL